jgi:hypothetical protein
MNVSNPSCSSSRMAFPHVVRACPNSRLSVVSDGMDCPGATSPARICLRSRVAIRIYGRGSASPRSIGRLMVHLRLPMNHASPWSSALVNNCQRPAQMAVRHEEPGRLNAWAVDDRAPD